MSVAWEDFMPHNNWEVWEIGPKYGDSTTPRYIRDKSTGRVYFNEPPEIVGLKCFLLTLGTPLVHLAASVCNILYRAMKLVTGAHFWEEEDCKPYSLEDRLEEAGKDALRILISPLAIIGLELSALYGMIMPYDGRKLYASIERAMYESFILAPCFQPDPKHHLLGGDVMERGAF